MLACVIRRQEEPERQIQDYEKKGISLSGIDREEILEGIREGGLTGMGGAGFPTFRKYETDKQMDALLINGAECEPFLTCDYRLMTEQGYGLWNGVRLLLKASGAKKAYVCIEDNKPAAIENLRQILEEIKGQGILEPSEDLEVKALPARYPQGGERQLIYAVTGRSINSKMLPADVGCIVDNVETIVAIYHAVKLGQPLTNRIFTVTGDAVCEPRNFYISIGTSYQELLEAAGGLIKPAKKMISGGPMMGFALFDLDVPTTKTTSALLCMTEDEASKYETTACINCGRCVEACPEQLVPSRLADFSAHGQKDMFEKWYGLECVECGSCSYVCPARRPLAQAVKTMKKDVLADKRKKK